MFGGVVARQVTDKLRVFKKAAHSIVVTVVGIVISLSPVQLLKELKLIVVSPSGNVISAIDVQPLKA